MDSKIRIKDWNKFQHFKDRRPIWIKLYRDIMDDVEWHELSGDDAKTLVMLWLLASEDDGNLPDIKTISFRLRLSQPVVLAALQNLSHWLDINMISDVYQDDTLETEKRREETEKNTPTSGGGSKSKKHDEAVKGAAIPDCLNFPVFVDVWAEFCQDRREKGKYMTDRSVKAMLSKLEKAGCPAAVEALNESLAQGWTGVFPKTGQSRTDAPTQILTSQPAVYTEPDQEGF